VINLAIQTDGVLGGSVGIVKPLAERNVITLQFGDLDAIAQDLR
jgi:hypothetical protein